MYYKNNFKINMKTTDELNSKWWYRLAKVVFIGSTLFFMVVSVFVIQDDNRPRQVKDYKIDCVADYSNKKSFLAEKDANIYSIYSYGTVTPYTSLSVDDKKRLENIAIFQKKKRKMQQIKPLIMFPNKKKMEY